MKTHQKRHIGAVIQGNALILFTRLLGLLPIGLCSALGYWLGVVIGPRNKVRDARLRHNLKILRPDLATPEIIEKTVRRYWGNSGRAMTEFAVLDALWTSKRMSVKGIEHLNAARASGRPRIGLFLHLGNWELVGPKMLEMGETSSQVVQTLVNPYRNKIAARARRRFTSQLIHAGPSAGRQILRLLLEKGYLSMAADEFQAGVLLAPAFGGALRLDGNLGRAVRLAKMTNALICLSYCVRIHGAHFEMTLLPPISLDLSGDDYLSRGVELLDAAITSTIVTHLDQWLMLDNFQVRTPAPQSPR